METREHVTRKFRDIDEDKLMELAYGYCDDCMAGKKEVATGSGKIVEIRDRHVPTIDYFLDHWLRKHNFEFYQRMNLWKIRQDPTHPYYEITTHIVAMFKSLATDIVANEGKAIFYAKNALGMTDRQQTENTNIDTITIKYES
jgi:hypothetical protein